MGLQSPPHGSGHPGLETHPRPLRQYLLLSSHRRLDRSDLLHWHKSLKPGLFRTDTLEQQATVKLRDEVLNVEIFDTLLEAKVLIDRRRREYNHVRPHSSLGYRPPAPEALIPINHELPGMGLLRVNSSPKILTLEVVQGMGAGQRLKGSSIKFRACWRRLAVTPNDLIC